VADQFQKMPESLLILDFFLGRSGKLEVDFSEVHADCLRSHCLEEVLNEVQREAILLGSTRRPKALGIDRVNVEGNPVLVISLFEILGELSLDGTDVLFEALLSFKDQYVSVLDKLELLRFIRPNAKVANLFGEVQAFPLSLVWNHARQVSQWHAMYILAR